MDVEQYNKALGAELRALRERRGLTRQQLNARLSDGRSVQTLATYELGLRAATAYRVFEICQALDEPVEDLMGRVRLRVEGPKGTSLMLDLAATARSSQPGLEPVRAWARSLLRERHGENRTVGLAGPALLQLAELCQLETSDLVIRLTGAGLVHYLDQSND